MPPRRTMASAGTVFQFKDGVVSSVGFLVCIRNELVCMAAGTIRLVGGVWPSDDLTVLFVTVSTQRCHRMGAVVRRGMVISNGRRPSDSGMAGVARGN